jgi:hypothetical protein
MGCDVGIFGMALGRSGEFSNFLRQCLCADQSCAERAGCEASCYLDDSKCLMGSDPVFTSEFLGKLIGEINFSLTIN